MDKIGDIVTNLIAAFIGFSMGGLRSFLQRLLRVRRAKRFWRPFGDGELGVVLAVFNDLNHLEWERSGVAGVGDVVALTEIERRLRKVRVDDYQVLYAHRVDGDQLRFNMVLIGGADSNKITRMVMDRLPLTFVYCDPDQHDVGFLDRRTGQIARPTSNKDGRLESDLGIVVRAKNPFDNESSVLIIAGSYGFGSAAAARVINDKKFLKNQLVKSGRPFEALISTSIVENVAQDVSVSEIRELIY